MIDDDSDFQNILSLVYPLSVDRVDVTITEMGISNEKHRVRESGDASGSNVIDDEMDLLPMFCQHENGFCCLVKNLLEVQRISGLHYFVYVKNEKCRVTAVCSMRESKGCLWRVHASLKRLYTAIRTSKNSRMSSNLVTSLIVNEVRRNSQTHPIDVVRQFTDQYSLTITYNHAWFGVEKARTTTFGDFSMSYDEI
ncbi:hypothetical protein ACSBR2_019213 [Camellia fascicularis]